MNDREAGVHPAPHPFRWVIFGAMCVVYFAFGVILLAIPPMVYEVRADLGISRGMLGFALGAWALLYMVTAPPAGQMIDRIGLRRSLAAGALLVAAVGGSPIAAHGMVMLWVAIAVIGIGGPLVSLAGAKAGRGVVPRPARTSACRRVVHLGAAARWRVRTAADELGAAAAVG